MNSFENDSALLVAEHLMEYSRRIERQKKLQKEQYIQHKKEVRRSRKYTVLFIGVAVVMLCLCMIMISLAMQVREREERISGLKIEISEIRKVNKEAERRVYGLNDYRWVREEAIKLGMSQVTADRVIYYSVDDADYMVQFDNIPKG